MKRERERQRFVPTPIRNPYETPHELEKNDCNVTNTCGDQVDPEKATFWRDDHSYQEQLRAMDRVDCQKAPDRLVTTARHLLSPASLATTTAPLRTICDPLRGSCHGPLSTMVISYMKNEKVVQYGNIFHWSKQACHKCTKVT